MMGPGIGSKDNDILKELGLVSQLRGTDSSGIYQVRSRPGTNWYRNGQSYSSGIDYESFYKTCDNFSEFLDDIGHLRTSAPKMLLSSMMVDIVMGHVRSATRGSINDDNAHPFRFSNIVAAHNGTLKDKKYQDPKKTDSEMMFTEMNTRGIIPVLENLDRDSAYALSIFDRTERKMYFVRNELRTLSFAFLKDRAVMYWASELNMLKFVLGRNGINTKDLETFTLKPGALCSVSVEDITRKNIEEDCLSILKLESKYDRVIPTSTENRLKAEEALKKKLEEEKEKADLDAKAKAAEDARLKVLQEEEAYRLGQDSPPFDVDPPKESAEELEKMYEGSIFNPDGSLKPDVMAENLKRDKSHETDYGSVKDGTLRVNDTLLIEDKTKKGGEVIPFPRGSTTPLVSKKANSSGSNKNRDSSGKFTAKKFMTKCSCGGNQFNLINQSKISRGVWEGYRYDESSDTFYCNIKGCDPLTTTEAKA